MKLKKIICSVVLVVCTLFFAGCANIEYQRRVDDLGQVLDKFTVELDYDKLKAKGYSDSKITSLLEEIKLDVQHNFADVILANLKLLQATQPSVYYAIRPSIGLNESVTRIMDFENKILKVSYEVLFENSAQYTASEIMAYAYGVADNEQESEDVPLETRKEDFITKYVQKSANFFGDITTEGLFVEYQSAYPEFNAEDITLTQIYGSTNYRLKSNADYVQTIDGYKCHLWEMTVAKAKDFDLEFYYISPTTSSWYVLALGLSLGLVVVLVTVYLGKRYKENNKLTKIELTEENSGEEE